MKKKGSFLFVLHAHLPYILDTDAEYWLHEAVLNSYLPFLSMLYQLSQENIYPKITINLSPILLYQLNHPEFYQKFIRYTNTRKRLYSVSINDSISKILHELALKQENLLNEFHELWQGNIIEGFKYFEKKGVLEIITSAFTHPYLPLMQPFPNLINAQIQEGVSLSKKIFNSIQGFWSPECGILPELPHYLKNNNLSYFFADPHSIAECPVEYKEYYIWEWNEVQYFLRDRELTNLIWDSDLGYPGYKDYREFYYDFSRESETAGSILKENNLFQSGFSIRAVTDKNSDNKEFYNHDKAQIQCYNHALEFSKEVHKKFLFLQSKMDTPCISIFFDMELFGHWWYEGNDFLYHMMKEVNELLEHPSKLNVSSKLYEPQLSSWGLNNDAHTWINEKTQKIWEEIFQMNRKTEVLNIFQMPNDVKQSLFLSQASDWPFLIFYDSFPELASYIVRSNINYVNNYLK